MPVDLHQLPPLSGVVLSLQAQINENRRTIREILCMDPFKHKVSIMLFLNITYCKQNKIVRLFLRQNLLINDLVPSCICKLASCRILLIYCLGKKREKLLLRTLLREEAFFVIVLASGFYSFNFLILQLNPIVIITLLLTITNTASPLFLSKKLYDFLL